MRASLWILLPLSLVCSIGAGCSSAQAPEEFFGDRGGASGVSTGEDFPSPGVVTVGSGVFSQPGVWTKAYGDALDQRAGAFAVNAAGDIALTGSALGTIDFGNVPWIGKATDEDVFVAKLDSDGHSTWSRRYGDSCDQHGGAVALAPSGNVLLAGDFCGKMDFGDTTLAAPAGEVDLFIAVIDTLGQDIYSRRIGGAGPQMARAAAVDEEGNAIVVGSFEKAFDDGNGAVASAGMDDVFVIKLDPAGKVLWSRTFGGPEIDLARSVAVDKAGNVILGGSFGNSLDFGGGPLTAVTDHSSGFLVELDPDGKHLWSQSLGIEGDTVVNSVAVSVYGTIGATGSFTGSIDLGKGPELSHGAEDAFVLTLKSNGSPPWGRTFGGVLSQRGTGITLGLFDEVGLSGTSSEAFDFGGYGVGTSSPSGPEMIYFIRLDATGLPHQARSLGSTEPMESIGVGMDGELGSILVGSFQKSFSSADQPQTVESAGGWDVFVSHQP